VTIPARLVPLLEQYDFAVERLVTRMGGPLSNSGDGSPVAVTEMTDAEYLWEPVAGCWSVRRRTDGPGERAVKLLGDGEWGRDASPESPYPPPFTTIGWRLSHLVETLVLRADHTSGTHTVMRPEFLSTGSAREAILSLQSGAAAWRHSLVTADDAALDTVGYSTYPYGSDAEDTFLDIVWWMNQEVLHHGAEIALLRDLYRDTPA